MKVRLDVGHNKKSEQTAHNVPVCRVDQAPENRQTSGVIARQFRCSSADESSTILLLFPRRSRWWIVATSAVLFSLLAVVVGRWYEWGIATAFRVANGGHQMRLVHHSPE